jgi:hypothetical protein
VQRFPDIKLAELLSAEATFSAADNNGDGQIDVTGTLAKVQSDRVLTLSWLSYRARQMADKGEFDIWR